MLAGKKREISFFFRKARVHMGVETRLESEVRAEVLKKLTLHPSTLTPIQSSP